MIDNEQIVEVKITKNNREYYVNKGYEITDRTKIISVKVKDLYEKSRMYVDTECDICKTKRKLAYRDYIKNTDRNCGLYICHRCSIQVRHNKTLHQRQEEYIKRLESECHQRGYTLLTKADEILNNSSYVKYECPLHGIHTMKIQNFLSGRGCPDCAYDLANQRYKLTQDEIISKVNKCNGELLNPEDYINNSTHNLKFRCNNCGEIFISSLQRFTQHGGQLCRKCSKIESIGELRVKKYLETKNIDFEQQKWFSDCRDIKPLPFDFYLPSLNTIIEFDGRQHFQDTSYFSYSLEKVKNHDNIKNNYCSNNNISLLRIPYTKINHIDEILNEKLFT